MTFKVTARKRPSSKICQRKHLMMTRDIHANTHARMCLAIAVFGGHWRHLESTEVHWSPLESPGIDLTGVYWTTLEFTGVDWSSLDLLASPCTGVAGALNPARAANLRPARNVAALKCSSRRYGGAYG